MIRPKTLGGPEKAEAPARTWNISAKRDPELEAAIGRRIRACRLAAGLSQGDLAAAAGIRYQQVQKYETGHDRIPASTVVRFAGVLGVHSGSLLDDGMAVPVGEVPDVRHMLRAAEILQRIRDPRVLSQILVLAKMLADVVPALEDPAGGGEGTISSVCASDVTD